MSDTSFVAPNPFLPPEGFDMQAGIARENEALAATREVFGDDHLLGNWAYQQNARFGKDRYGGTQTPARAAYESAEGLAHVLATLAELAPTITPRWRPKIKGQTKRTFKRHR